MTAIAHTHFEHPRRFQSTRGAGSVGNLITDKAIEIFEKLNSSTTAQDRPSIVLDALLKLMEECATNNWDGYGAPAITSTTLDKTREFTESLSPEIPTPDFSPEPDGEIAVEWYGKNGASISISVGDSDTINYAAIFPDQYKVNGTESFHGKNKGIIETYINRVISKE